ncbi:hypothetical protein C4D60_Mb06t05970 [Musa balbisiana]|uniref:RanBP2-type domain-containing protein n=1 Tax=Musa balbisiana TaxID=52838 RepID=A0A4S8IKW4_MUSBA|nr:hypothetical protein C4D60_Mb06t05970 [Musa balbisiana]
MYIPSGQETGTAVYASTTTSAGVTPASNAVTPGCASGDFSDYAGLGGGRVGSSFGAVSDVRPGDWYCSCGGHNFASRSSCHSCGAFRDESAVGVIGGFDNSEMAGSQGITYGGGGWKSGDWLCTRSGCNHHNFASRRECYRCKAPKGCGA